MADDYWEKQATYWQRQAVFQERLYQAALKILVDLVEQGDQGNVFLHQSNDGSGACFYCDAYYHYDTPHYPHAADCPAAKALSWVANALWDAEAKAEVMATGDEEESDTDEE